eukprot:8541465-Alexandrium_andersonii.AAC.1
MALQPVSKGLPNRRNDGRRPSCERPTPLVQRCPEQSQEAPSEAFWTTPRPWPMPPARCRARPRLNSGQAARG